MLVLWFEAGLWCDAMWSSPCVIHCGGMNDAEIDVMMMMMRILISILILIWVCLCACNMFSNKFWLVIVFLYHQHQHLIFWICSSTLCPCSHAWTNRQRIYHKLAKNLLIFMNEIVEFYLYSTYSINNKLCRWIESVFLLERITPRTTSAQTLSQSAIREIPLRAVRQIPARQWKRE